MKQFYKQSKLMLRTTWNAQSASKKIAIVSSTLLLSLLPFQHRANAIMAMPGQSFEIDGKIPAEIVSYEIERGKDGSAGACRATGRIDGETFSAAVNHPALVRGKWIVPLDFGTLHVSNCSARDVGAAVAAMSLLAAAWTAAGIKWIAIPLLLLAAGLPFSCGLTDWQNPLRNIRGVFLAMSLAIPALAIADKSLRWIDLFLEFIAIMPLFVLETGGASLPPALQSPFFVPHAACYAIGFAIAIRIAFGIGLRFAALGFALTTTGLVLGAAWGQCCWGSWWNWDPKECFSMATWMVTGTGFLFKRKSIRLSAWRIGACLSIATLTLANFSARFSGLHSYAH